MNYLNGLNKKRHNFDFLRIIAIFSVILLHTSSSPFKIWSDNWTQFNIIMSATRWCVPVLFMLSGALLIGKNEPIILFFKKRIFKIIIPLIFWSYIYILFARNFYQLDPAHANPNVFFEPWLLLKYSAYFHLWFLYAIIGVYLMIPLLRIISYNEAVVQYSLLLWFIWFSAIPFLQSFDIIKGNLFFIFKLDVIPLWSGFALLGYFLQKNECKIKISYAIIVFLIGLISTIYLTYFVSSNGIPKETYQAYFMPNILMMSCGIYIILMKIKTTPTSISKISKYSFGIYLCHMLIMPLIWKIKYFNNIYLAESNFIFTVMSSILTFTLSLILVFILSKIPLLRRVV